MSLKLSARTRLAVGLAAACLGGALAYYIYRTFRPRRKPSGLPAQLEAFPETEHVEETLLTSVERQVLTQQPADKAESSQEASAGDAHEDTPTKHSSIEEQIVVEQVHTTDTAAPVSNEHSMPPDAGSTADDSQKLAGRYQGDDLSTVESTVLESMVELSSSPSDLDITPEEVSATLATKDENDIVVVTDESIEVLKQQCISFDGYVVTDESINALKQEVPESFDGSIITDESIEALKQEVPISFDGSIATDESIAVLKEDELPCGEPQGFGDDAVMAEETMSKITINPPSLDSENPSAAAEEVHSDTVSDETDGIASPDNTSSPIESDLSNPTGDAAGINNPVENQQDDNKVTKSHDETDAIPWMQRFDGTVMNAKPDDSPSESTEDAHERMHKALEDIRKMRSKSNQEAPAEEPAEAAGVDVVEAKVDLQWVSKEEESA